MIKLTKSNQFFRNCYKFNKLYDCYFIDVLNMRFNFVCKYCNRVLFFFEIEKIKDLKPSLNFDDFKTLFLKVIKEHEIDEIDFFKFHLRDKH